MFVPPHGGARATAIAIFNIFGAVGGFIGPTLLGKLSDAGGDYAKAMLVLGAMDLASALMFLGALRPWNPALLFFAHPVQDLGACACGWARRS